MPSWLAALGPAPPPPPDRQAAAQPRLSWSSVCFPPTMLVSSHVGPGCLLLAAPACTAAAKLPALTSCLRASRALLAIHVGFCECPGLWARCCAAVRRKRRLGGRHAVIAGAPSAPARPAALARGKRGRGGRRQRWRDSHSCGLAAAATAAAAHGRRRGQGRRHGPWFTAGGADAAATTAASNLKLVSLVEARLGGKYPGVKTN